MTTTSEDFDNSDDDDDGNNNDNDDHNDEDNNNDDDNDNDDNANNDDAFVFVYLSQEDKFENLCMSGATRLRDGMERERESGRWVDGKLRDCVFV